MQRGPTIHKICTADVRPHGVDNKAGKKEKEKIK